MHQAARHASLSSPRSSRRRLGLRVCALRSPNIADLSDNPGRYQDRSVSIDGVVTSSWGVPLVPFRIYKVDDGTGEVTVLSQGSRTPTRGARVHVKGRVERGRRVRRPGARAASARGGTGHPAAETENLRS